LAISSIPPINLPDNAHFPVSQSSEKRCGAGQAATQQKAGAARTPPEAYDQAIQHRAGTRGAARIRCQDQAEKICTSAWPDAAAFPAAIETEFGLYFCCLLIRQGAEVQMPIETSAPPLPLTEEEKKKKGQR
jgi:hypothetical protein